MSADNVRLIVKAANQETTAHIIECKLFWTVNQVKCHLAQVYPGKPPADEQKIIYFGQLLEDESTLREVLRSTDDVTTFTIHLVFMPKRDKLSKKPEPSSSEPKQETAAEIAQPEGLRLRHPEVRQNDQNHTVEIQNYLTSVMNYGRVPPYPPNLDAGLSAGMTFAQTYHENYIQYMQQYAQWYATQNGQAAAQPNAETETLQPEAEVVPAEAEEVGRDWLDWTYAVSRAAILSCLVYFYSSPSRLLLVILLCLLIYLHQVGFFRQLGVNAGQRQEPENLANDNQPQVPIANEPAQEDAPQSILAVTWMIFISFFTSLIPETQQ